MTSFDDSVGRLRSAASHLLSAANSAAAVAGSIAAPIRGPWGTFTLWLKTVMPKGLYARALLIIILPMVVLQSVVAFMFVERQWSVVNRYLSSAVTREIATLIDVYKTYPQGADRAQLRRIAQDRLGLVVDFLPETQLPPPGPKPFFSQPDAALSDEIRKQIRLPFWIDTVGRSSIVEIRIKLDDTIMRVFARRADAYDANAWIFLLWMVATSLVVLTIAILFLRNQIRPIVRLADAAEAFGKGREVQNFRPRGAREVRRAAAAFVEMKIRIERAIEQRTTMLAGVSHDLRTILTRFKLELALLGDSPEVEAIKKDVDEMAAMLEAYLAFARGDLGEQPAPTDMPAMLDELKADSERHGHRATVAFHGQPEVTVRPAAFKRCLANLVSNAGRFASTVAITGHRDHRWLTVTVDDDGPGIPTSLREDVFKPFLRLDDARNQDEGGTGLGLAIARDIARSHGGDITLGDSPLGGLRAAVRVPV
ncbi:MAG: ATP-binding protein [Xanthobacteraceae bacterium]|jgi:two-component system, OmpR family, osmolarity sensor histidine kinase EnvZ